MILLTEAELAQARRNARTTAWGRAERDRIAAACQPFVERSDEALWSLVTGQQIPRGIHVNPDLGCPSCGRRVYEEHGNYPWIVSLERPFQLACPSCGEVWPKNDFAAYHASGLGPGGVFERTRADASLLINAEHPDPADPLRGFAVDDGLGWVDGDGQRWWFVAYFSHYCTWSLLPRAARDLARAFVLTGESIYAHKGLVLLDRIADVYPDMDLAPYSAMDLYNSHGGTGKGRLQGCIWETFIAEDLARAVDALMPVIDGDAEVVDFLTAQARTWQLGNDKGTPARIRSNLRDGLLREFVASCRDGRIAGNEGMTQTTMAVAAAVLDDPDETPAALDWLYEPGRRGHGGGHIPATLVGEVDRDGVGNEASPSYCFIWMNLFRRCAEVLERCRHHRDVDLHRDFPRLRRMYAAPHRLTALDRYTPHIGDTAKTGDPGQISVDLQMTVEVFARFGETWAAQLAWQLNGGRADGLHTAITDADPEAVQARIAAVIERQGPLALHSANLNGYGLALLRHGDGAARRAAWLYYGRNTGHGHLDRLNYGLFYRGMDVLPDLGYPEYADGKWPKRAGWTRNTISHNTVVVNRRAQENSWVGRCQMWAATQGVGVVEVGCSEVYPETTIYRRVLACIDVSATESYVVDVFRVAGGEDHVLSFHAGEGNAEARGLDLVVQEEGTYAGADIPFGAHYDGAPDGRYRGSGFAYLWDVARAAAPAPGWHVDWELADTWGTRLGDDPVHVRFHGLSAVEEAATAWGEPPKNKPGNPKRLRYLLQRNRAAGPAPHGTPPNGTQPLRSLFCGVVEPYSGQQRTLQSVERIDLGEASEEQTRAALLVRTATGRIDHILSDDDGTTAVDLGEDVSVTARFAWIGRHAGADGAPAEAGGGSAAGSTAVEVLAVGAREVRLPEGVLRVERPRYTGRVVDFCRDETGGAWIDVDADLPTDGRLTGSQVRVLSDGPRDTCYDLAGVDRSGDRVRLDLGDTSLIRGFAQDRDYDAGYLYDLKVGDAVVIDTVVRGQVGGDGAFRAAVATADWDWVPA